MRSSLPGLLVFLATSILCLGADRALAQEPTTTGLMVARPILRVRDAQIPVQLESVDIRADVLGRFAHTRIELVFRNPNARVLEGELQFPLAPGQMVTGFALDIGGEMRSAVPVDKSKGQQVFEDVIRTQVDPALLEATQGDNYKLRVYPLPAQGTRRVALYLSQTLARHDKKHDVLTLPLNFGDRVGQLSTTVRVVDVAARNLVVRGAFAENAIRRRQENGSAVVEVQRTNVASPGALSIVIPARPQPLVASQVAAAQTFFYAEVPTQTWSEPRPAPRRLALLWDASGSGARRDHARELAVLDRYFKALRDVSVDLIVGRDVVETPRRFLVRGGRWDELRRALAGLAYDGATNLAALNAPADCDLALLFSDGLENWRPVGVGDNNVPLYALSAASSVDSLRLRALAQRTGGEWLDLSNQTASQVVATLQVRKARLLGMRGNGLHDLVSASPYPENDTLTVAGVIRVDQTDLELEFGFNEARTRRQHVKIVARLTSLIAADDGPAVLGQRWAALRVAELDANFEQNRAEIRRLGKSFGLLTRETSLIVLDNAADYARNEIEPPRSLRADYERLLALQNTTRQKAQVDHLNRVATRFAGKVTWWESAFPKDMPPVAVARTRPSADAVDSARSTAAVPAPMRQLRSEARSPAAIAGAAGNRTDDARAKSLEKASGASAASGSTIQLTKWEPDSPYARRLRAASAETVYRQYLEERPVFTSSTAFFLDAADVLFEKGLPELGLRVLSNLAEMDLENRHILRVLAYRLLQAKQPRLAIPVLQAVQRLSPGEPQSYRDLGLAYAEAESWQDAVNQLWEVVSRPWNNRFPDVELIALAELNAVAARAQLRGAPVQTTAFDARLMRNLPLDLRVVLAWDADNTDIDLWVIDPNGETAFYGKPSTYQGGRMSADFTGGYGPEEFSLHRAKPGKYTVQAQFYGHRQQIVAPATTLMMRLTAGFGTADQRDELVTLRLGGKNELITVGSFEVGMDGLLVGSAADTATARPASLSR